MEELNESLSGEKEGAKYAQMEMKECRERLKTTLEPTMLPEYPKHGVIGWGLPYNGLCVSVGHGCVHCI